MQPSNLFVNKVFYIEWLPDNILFHVTKTVEKFVKGYGSYAFSNMAEF